MVANSTIDGLLAIQSPAQLPGFPRALVLILLCLCCSSIPFVTSLGDKSSLPYVNYNRSHWTYAKAKLAFQQNARGLISKGFRDFSGPFNIVTSNGPIIMLPPEYIEVVTAEPKLSFPKYVEDELLGSLDTFQNFHADSLQLFVDPVLKGLTRSLPKFTKPLSDEMSRCLDDTWSTSTEWHQVPARKDALRWVARLSSRVFLGELAENEEWLQLSMNNTVKVFTASDQLKYNYPKFLIPLVDKFLPLCRRVRADREACFRILQPILDKRNAEIGAAAEEGRTPDVPDDSIEWFRKFSKGRRYKDVNAQLGLSIVAIHTTTDLLTQALLNLCTHPEYVEPLREEAIRVLSQFGWKKVALTELRLLDSFVKETQRLKPMGMAMMHRLATADVTLPGNIHIKKGERVGISSHRMWSEDVYERADKFDGHRFFRRRQVAGLENRSLLVTTSTEHTGFGHGRQACPGRFFAANEVKIAMVHVLLKYDIKLEDRDSAKWVESGNRMMASYTAMPHVRRRKEEINLDDLVVE